MRSRSPTDRRSASIRSTSGRVHASLPPGTRSYAPGSRRLCSPNKNRLQRLELRPLAKRGLLPAAPPCARVAALLRAALRYRRAQQHLLPPPAHDRGRALGRGDAAGLRVRGQGEPLLDAHRSAPQHGGASGTAPRADRAARWLVEARAAPLAAAADVPPRRRASRHRARRAATRATARIRVPGRELVRSGGMQLLRERDVALVIADRPEIRS